METTSPKSLAEVDADLFTAMQAYLESFASHLPVRRVAVVGNAPLEVSAERQQAIDSADLVFRCNSFVLDQPGEEPRLGTKTDVVVAARQARISPCFLQGYRRRAYLMMDAGTMMRARPRAYPAWWPEDLVAWPIPNRLFGLPLRVYMRPEAGGVGVVPTTGTMSAYVAHELFPEAELVLTGFSYLHDREQTAWSHQWGSTDQVHSAHRIDREGALLQSWVDDGSAVFLG
jgi:hypothetical protein